MSDLVQAVETFASAVARFEKKFGTIALRSSVAIDLPFQLGDALSEFYSRLGLRDKPAIGGSLHIMLFPLEQLASAQEGWRWISSRDGSRSEDMNWPANWVVFADRNGDAIVADVASSGAAIQGSIQKRNVPIAPDLASFLRALAACLDEERTAFDYEVMGDDFEILDAYRSAVETIARDKLGDDGARGFMKFFCSRRTGVCDRQAVTGASGANVSRNCGARQSVVISPCVGSTLHERARDFACP